MYGLIVRYLKLFLSILLLSFTVPEYFLYCQPEPELIISQHEFSICQGDMALVEIEILGTPRVFIDYVFEGDTFNVSSTKTHIELELYDPGIYHIIRFGDSYSAVEDVKDSIVVIEFDAPNIYFTGGGTFCSSEDPVPLQAHFEGNPPFVLYYFINGEPDTLYVTSNSYTFDYNGPILIITQSLADNNCRMDIVLSAQYEILDVSQPVIYGDSVFCEMDSTIFSTHQNTLSAEWIIPEGADYIEGTNSEGSFITVTWTEAGIHEVWLRLYDSGSECSSLWSVLQVVVHDKPVATGSLDTTLCLESGEYLPVEIQTGPDENVFWPELGITGSTIEINVSGTYTFIQSNQYGCSDSGTVVFTSNCVQDIFVPEAFSPNGDQINDYLEIFGLFEELELSIYSPSGILLYQMTADDPPWDGTINGHPVPCGSYYWSATFRIRDGMSFKKTGVVTLIR
jgi:gliding motility-associated-like protein